VSTPSITDLAAVASVENGAMFDEGLATAVSSGVLVRHRQDVDFRHALFREAALVRLASHHARRSHAAWAEVVERQPSSLTQAITLAHHLAESGDTARALDACLAARDVGDLLGAFPEVYRVLLKASELWPRVPDAESRTGRDLSALVAEAAEAAIVGEGRIEEGKELLRRARAALPADAPPGRSAWLDLVWNWAARAGDGTETLSDDELIEVVAAIPREPARLRWWACQDAAETLFGAGRTDEAEPYVRELLDMSEGTNDGAIANAMRYRARLERDRGHCAEAVEIARDAVRRADRFGQFLYRARCRDTFWQCLYDVGDLPGAADAAQHAVTLWGGDRPGPVSAEWAASVCNLAELLLDLGRWQEAHVQAAAVLDAENVSASTHVWARGVQTLVRARRGTDLSPGSRSAEDEQQSGTGRAYFMFDELVEAERRRWVGDLSGARAAIRPVLEQEPPIGNILMAVRAFALAASLEADREPQAQPVERQDWSGRLRRLLDALPLLGPIDDAFVETARAQLARRDAADSPEMWAAVVDRWRALAIPFELGQSLLRLGECAARAGRADDAKAAFEETVRIATDLDAVPLVEAVESAARRARVRLSSMQSRTPTSFGLTTRELEVLRLLADGATNGAIAKQLFMSPKTASVHVSHVIAKLGVANRTEAAAIAHRNGLLG